MIEEKQILKPEIYILNTLNKTGIENTNILAESYLFTRFTGHGKFKGLLFQRDSHSTSLVFKHIDHVFNNVSVNLLRLSIL